MNENAYDHRYHSPDFVIELKDDPPVNDTSSDSNEDNSVSIRKEDVYKVLQKIRNNCINLSIYHNKRYHFYKNILFSFFRIPLIMLSGFNSFFAVGMQEQISQSTISIINSLLSLLCGILTSIELLWNLQKRMEIELDSHKSYYKLSIEIFKFMELDENLKGSESKIYLNTVYKNYEQLITTSNAVNVYRRGFNDELEVVDGKSIEIIPPNYYCNCFW
jgi:hypothetical protein